MYKCLICNRPLEDYEPDYCCNGSDCCCRGEPLNPPVCCDECHDALMKGIGKPYEQRRIDAGIKWIEDKKE